MAETWPQWLVSGEHIAQAIDWVRWKSQDRAKITIAIGAQGVAVAKPRELDAEDAIVILTDVLEQINRALRELDERRVTHLATVLSLR